MTPEEMIAATFPVRTERAELEVLQTYREGPRLGVTARLLVFDGAGDARALRHAIEQELFFRPQEHGDPRFAAYLRGWADALAELFDDAAAPADLDGIFPRDLQGADVLRLRRPRDAEDFTAALLGPNRLGRLLRR